MGNSWEKGQMEVRRRQGKLSDFRWESSIGGRVSDSERGGFEWREGRVK